ncbi:MAG TPA: class I SAM-dependent methyltransferase [Chitinophagaceae bacterium]
MTIERSASGQIITREKKPYNERLFSKGWRRYLHEARYHWLNRKIRQYLPGKPSVLELGCFDAKTIDYLPAGFSRYTGYDANWEGGLELGKQRWKDRPDVMLIESQNLSGFNPANEKYDCSIALETVEHIAIAELDGYLRKLADSTRHYCFISVPYEQGVPLLLKYLYKSVLRKVDEPYRPAELVAAIRGDLQQVQRVEHGHKGFDYRDLLRKMEPHFAIVEITPLPFRRLPQQLNFSVGIVARPRHNDRKT